MITRRAPEKWRFNSRSREGSDRPPAWPRWRQNQFQFALPRGERPVAFFGSKANIMFQFALPRGERHTRGVVIQPSFKVSIRAPARGATPPPKQRRNYAKVSIRAPARGATSYPAPERSAPPVSIRAPARGATVTYMDSDWYDVVSIRAPARGATQVSDTASIPVTFQFALPRGERRCSPPNAG